MIKYAALGVLCIFAIAMGYRCVIVGPTYTPPVVATPVVAYVTATPEPFDVSEWEDSRFFHETAMCMLEDPEFHEMGNALADLPLDSPRHLEFYTALVELGDSGNSICGSLHLAAERALR